MKKEKKKVESGLGEFWDNWIAEAEQEEKHLKELIEQRKKEAKKHIKDKET